METERTPDDVFRLLSDGIRLDILSVIAIEQHQKEEGVGMLTFSAIYDRVDVDNTSKLSYHLGELTGTFLRKTDAGYAFTHAGEEMARFILAENYQQPADIGRIETAGSCLHCNENELYATRAEQFFTIRCSACERPSFVYVITPAQVRSHGGEQLVTSVTWEHAADFLKIRHGLCPACAGKMTTHVRDVSDVASVEAVPARYAAASECEECLRYVSIPLTHTAAYHQESIAFHWDRGVDILGSGAWRLHHNLHDGQWTAERTETDPDEYRVDLRHETAMLRLFLDEHAAVTRTERVQRREG